ncbi:prolyl oligopeptidase [Cavenderia fasciculata]|uniref:Prolyl endopeptidase n=1 Tax=Cavenderia fasciculata TaxID=261658 RepID=F4PJH3_CACFS|nr:prolyl oligopeptidase [Cavenderia fasciculata]EGG24459.1 prolyl oligopeptidase [Cavenderia fasciculata]|eukprot:XP_004362310.1 prolyl oligopeptidase [Cavenderia fasciculata]
MIKYPQTFRDETAVDSYKRSDGTTQQVADPYRWLENQDDPRTISWVKEQNQVTSNFINEKLTDQLHQEYMSRVNYEKFSWFRRRGSRLFFDKNPGLLNQSIIYFIDLDDSTQTEHVLIDPNSYAKDGTWSLSSIQISNSGKLVAYGYSQSGSDWVNFKVIRINGSEIEHLSDHLEYSKFSHPVWDQNETGFIYGRFPPPPTTTTTTTTTTTADTLDSSLGTENDVNEYQKLYYHRLGTQQSQDILIYESKEHSQYMFSVEFTTDYKYLVIYTSRDCNPEVNLSVITNWESVINDKTSTSFEEIKLVTDFNASYNLIHSVDDMFYLTTNLDAPLNRLIYFQLPKQSGQPLEIKSLVGQATDNLESVTSSSNKFYLSYLKDVQDVIKVYDIKGQYLYDIELPGPGCVSSFAANPYHTHIYFSFASFTYPSTIFYLNTIDDKVKLFKEPTVKNFNSNDYVCKQLFYNSKDGTRVPMFVVHKKDFAPKQSKPAPLMLYGYGGFEISLSPYFSLQNIFFIDKFDGVFVQANIRGGGEYGKEWHKNGSLHNKQNCFDDFISAAEYLMDQGYTTKDLITINGGSNGGLLVAATTNQRPDLFKVSIGEVGVYDMLKFHKFTVGSHWSSDYGCSEDPKDFDVLFGYSPINNVNLDAVKNKGITYPATLLLTGDHDDRVVPSHSKVPSIVLVVDTKFCWLPKKKT